MILDCLGGYSEITGSLEERGRRVRIRGDVRMEAEEGVMWAHEPRKAGSP